jgi:recombination protein RecA
MAKTKKAKPSGDFDLDSKALELFGEGALVTGSERMDGFDVSVISSGVPTLDYALGVGGLPRGRVVEIYGPEGTGKTLIIGLFVAGAQRIGGKGAIIDAEQALSPSFMEIAGVNYESLRVGLPDNGFQAFEMAELLCRANDYDVIGIDSVAALVTEQELAGDYADNHMAPLAKLMSQGLRKLTPIVHDSNAIVIFNNQIRTRPGVSFGNPEYQPGGRALPFYSSVRMDVRVAERFKDDAGVQLGHKVKITIKKNKVSAPHFTSFFNFYYREGNHSGYGDVVPGVDIGDSYLELAQTLGYIKQVSSWFHFVDKETGESVSKWNGRYAATTGIMEYKEILDKQIYR